MEIAVAIGLVLVGGIIGFFVARHWYGQGPTQSSIEQAENDLKALLSQQSEHHVFQSKQIIRNIQKQCAALNEQLNAYEGLLAPEEGEGKKAVPFYGEHASTYLRNHLDKGSERKAASQTDTQPRDFAAAGSGLFAGQAKEVVDNPDGTKSES
jgi:uncharacterized membrane-anchored protein YhcB (DUF1043 family)